MIRRGRIDHFALNAASKNAFNEIYRRLKAEGVQVGDVIDMGSIMLFTFTDPDQGEQEVAWAKPDVPVGNGLQRKEWTTVTIEPV
jgi:hypothetical protein